MCTGINARLEQMDEVEKSFYGFPFSNAIFSTKFHTFHVFITLLPVVASNDIQYFSK